MSGAQEATIINKRISFGLVAVKGIILLAVVGLIYTCILLPENRLLASYVSEDIHSFLVSQVIVSVSTLLYGLSLLLFRATSLSSLIAEVKKHAKPLLLTTLLANIFILLGYIVFVLPGVILTLLFFFYPFVVVEGERTTLGALKRSCQLFKYVWFQLLASVIGFYLLFILSAGILLAYVPALSHTAEIGCGTILFMIEAYVYYRLFQKAKKKHDKGGMTSDRGNRHSAPASK
ncbi:hypothetical protein GN156_06890 [bacterium LRH843]|nr:hypothetical protein [bacterium LRH843]